MVDLRCQECGHQEPWEEIREKSVPADDDEWAKAAQGRAHNRKVVCPECGNDSFDRVDDGE